MPGGRAVPGTPCGIGWFKIQDRASLKEGTGRREVAEEAARFDAKIAAYLAGLDEANVAEPDDEPQAVQAALAALRNRCAELDRLAAKFDDEERTTFVEGEADARPMGMRYGPKPPSYNVKTVVDADTDLILHHDVTGEPTDRRQLHAMASVTCSRICIRSAVESCPFMICYPSLDHRKLEFPAFCQRRAGSAVGF